MAASRIAVSPYYALSPTLSVALNGPRPDPAAARTTGSGHVPVSVQVRDDLTLPSRHGRVGPGLVALGLEALHDLCQSEQLPAKLRNRVIFPGQPFDERLSAKRLGLEVVAVLPSQSLAGLVDGTFALLFQAGQPGRDVVLQLPQDILTLVEEIPQRQQCIPRFGDNTPSFSNNCGTVAAEPPVGIGEGLSVAGQLGEPPRQFG